MAGMQKAENGKCPEGFKHVFGPLCIEETTLQQVDDALPDLPKIDFSFTNPTCESALAALNAIMGSIEQALEMPTKLLNMARSLMERPFDDLQNLVGTAMGFVNQITDILDDLVNGVSGVLDPLRDALESVLSCPIIADTPIGKAAAMILDALDQGISITGLVDQYKQLLMGAVSEVLGAIKKQPMAAIDNLQKLYDRALDEAKVNELMDMARKLLQCVKATCDMIKVGKRMKGIYDETSLDDLWKKAGGVKDEITGKFKKAALGSWEGAKKGAVKLYDDVMILQPMTGG